MSSERVVIASASLPDSLGEDGCDLSVAYYQLIGPVINANTLRLIEATFSRPEAGELLLVGYLLVHGYRVLNKSCAFFDPELYDYLRPLACSFTELGLTPEAIETVHQDDSLMDLVMEVYISNLLHDLIHFAQMRLPGKTLIIRGFYLSRRSGRLTPCMPLERNLTPRFGALSFAVGREGVRSFWPDV